MHIEIFTRRMRDGHCGVNTSKRKPFANRFRGWKWKKRAHSLFFEGIHPDEKVIMMHPDETILAHTHEFVGSTKRFVGVITTRSTPGRQAVEIKPVLWGDPGFIGRWTLVVNNPTPFITPIVVGRRLP